MTGFSFEIRLSWELGVYGEGDSSLRFVFVLFMQGDSHMQNGAAFGKALTSTSNVGYPKSCFLENFRWTIKKPLGVACLHPLIYGERTYLRVHISGRSFSNEFKSWLLDNETDLSSSA